MSGVEKFIESIVILIQAVFGFLPPWCLVFVGTAFGVVVAVIIYKLFRG